jgi:LlaJI restriction endonuclease
VEADLEIEWVREGDLWSENGDSRTVSLLIESGVLGLGTGGLRIRFVGAIVINGRALVSLPKVAVGMAPAEIQRCTLRAMRRYREGVPSHHEPSPFLNSSPDKGPVSTLAATDWLVREFAVHGLLRRTEAAYELNGRGHINWQRTVDNLHPLISHGRPLYLQTITGRSQNDHRNFATRLQCYLLERLSAKYAHILDLEPIVLDHEPIERLEALPSVEECEIRIGVEQRVTYSQRGMDLLAMMLATVKSLEVETELGLSLFGTSSFHHVWEAACAAVFGNEVGVWQPHIPKPTWSSVDGPSAEAETFIPDLVVPIRASELLIADAKYYRPSMPPALRGVPGVNDVAKQIWYKRCLQAESERRGFKTVQNVFLFPGDVPQPALLGHVQLPPGGEQIDAVAIPFTNALAVYSGDKASSPEKRRLELSALLLSPPPVRGR